MVPSASRRSEDRKLGCAFSDSRKCSSISSGVGPRCGSSPSITTPLAGLFCDGWHETVPNADETTGVAFHFDAPGARPPQAIVLAVPPAADAPAWSVEAILDTLVEAHDLARIRAVGPRQLEWLGTLLPAIYLPDSFSPDVPGVKVAGLAAKYWAANAATATILGKA